MPSEPLTVGPDSFLPCPAMALSDIPDVGSYFDVFVTFAASPHLFAVKQFFGFHYAGKMLIAEDFT